MVLVLFLALAQPAAAFVVAAEGRAEKSVYTQKSSKSNWWWTGAAGATAILLYGKRIFAKRARKRGCS